MQTNCNVRWRLSMKYSGNTFENSTFEEQPLSKSLARKTKSVEIDRDWLFLEDRHGHMFDEKIDRDRIKLADSYPEAQNVENRFYTHYWEWYHYHFILLSNGFHSITMGWFSVIRLCEISFRLKLLCGVRLLRCWGNIRLSFEAFWVQMPNAGWDTHFEVEHNK